MTILGECAVKIEILSTRISSVRKLQTCLSAGKWQIFALQPF